MGDKMKSIWRFGWMPSPPELSTYVNVKGLWRKVAGSLFVLVSKGKEVRRG